MGENSSIAWTDHTFNPWIGCTKVSSGCTNCYASVDTFARRSRANGLELWGPKAARHVTSEAYWRQPFTWDRKAAKAGVRERVFCGSLCDIFEDRDDLRATRARLFSVIAATPHLDWLLLTKRPERAGRLWEDAMRTPVSGRPHFTFESPWLPNVWLGTTCEDQQRANERIPHLLAAPAAIRFLSCEPLLGDLPNLLRPRQAHGSVSWLDSRRGADGELHAEIDWVIVGGESGQGARPFDLAWARSLRDQCRAAGASFFFKQAGARPLDSDIAANEWVVTHQKGGDPAEWPEDLRVRELPQGAS